MHPAPLSRPYVRALLGLGIIGGLLCGIGAILIFGPGIIAMTPEWLVVPAAGPVVLALATRRGPVLGLLAGLLCASVAFTVVGVYTLAKVACFILTFMGDC